MRSVEKDAFHSLISEVSLDPDRQTDHVFLDMAKQNGGELSARVRINLLQNLLISVIVVSAEQCFLLSCLATVYAS